MRHSRYSWMLIVAATVAAGGRCLGDEVTLKGSVRLAATDGVVRLTDIAEIDGPEAQRHAELRIAMLGRDGTPLEISVQDVRARLDEAGVHWGKVQLSGSKVIVRPPAHAARPPLAMTAVSVNAPAPTVTAATSASDGTALVALPTLRGVVADAVIRGLGIAPEDVRLAVDDHGDGILDVEHDDRRFEIQPLTSLASDRIELNVRTWVDGRITQRHSVTVQPSIRTDVVVLRRDLKRGDEIREADCTVERRWLVPSQAALMSNLVEAVGHVADTRLQAGDVLRTKHVKREVLIRRGDRVMVRCLVGGVVISLEAEARGEGSEGDQVELRKLGERDTFLATATGPGAAIIDLSR